jgi:hypothetical protein
MTRNIAASVHQRLLNYARADGAQLLPRGHNMGRKLAAKMFKEARQLTTVARLALARLLLESVLAGEPDDEANWLAMSLDTFQRDWDNAEDGIYDR